MLFTKTFNDNGKDVDAMGKMVIYVHLGIVTPSSQISCQKSDDVDVVVNFHLKSTNTFQIIADYVSINI